MYVCIIKTLYLFSTNICESVFVIYSFLVLCTRSNGNIEDFYFIISLRDILIKLPTNFHTYATKFVNKITNHYQPFISITYKYRGVYGYRIITEQPMYTLLCIRCGYNNIKVCILKLSSIQSLFIFASSKMLCFSFGLMKI